VGLKGSVLLVFDVIGHIWLHDDKISVVTHPDIHLPNHALQRTRRERGGCDSRVPNAGSLSLSRCRNYCMSHQCSPIGYQTLFW
jgi:hypothetical protein